MRSCAIACVLFVLAALGVDSARAQSGAGEALDNVRLDIPDCGAVRGDDVRALIALELAPGVHIATSDEAQPALRASVRCEGGDVASIGVAATGDASPLRLDVELSKAAPEARTRLLALSVAELIATRRLQHQEPAQPAAARAEPAQDEAPEQDSSARDASERATWRVWIGPGLARAASPATTLFGASAGVARTLGPLALSGELSALFGSAESSDANIAVQAFSTRIALAPQLALGAVVLSAGAGVRAGHVELAADAQRPELVGDSYAGLWFGPLALAAVDVDVARPGSLHFALETGYVVRGVAGQDALRQNTVLAMRGVWVSALAAVALAF